LGEYNLALCALPSLSQSQAAHHMTSAYLAACIGTNSE
jgi:hypothetical protein